MIDNKPAPAAPAILSIDYEDWFHGFDNDSGQPVVYPSRLLEETKLMLDLFDEHQAKATFFVLGECAVQYPALVKEIVARGHDIGTHGMRHRHVSELSPDEFREDIRQALDVLQDFSGTNVQSYRAPYFSLNASTPWAYEILRDMGIRCDSSSFAAIKPRHGQPNAKRLPHNLIPGISEYPVSTLPTPLGNIPFAGGAYFRIWPWHVLEFACKTLEKRGEPLIIYLHPYDLDADQPRLKLKSRFFTWRRYYGVNSAADKLARLLDRYRFTTFADVLASGSIPLHA